MRRCAKAARRAASTGCRSTPVPVLLSLHEVPGCGPIRPSHHLDVQFVATAPHDEFTISDESADLAWFDTTSPPPQTDQSVRDLMAAATRRLQEKPLAFSLCG
ncbi:hypothetical protein [Aeromicrobium sp. UC242_57]|uniref:hypothetical protein n=1 Tax=Aeromicrobium sp. UC242_57 TaxID=3374624 RepID=UPI0037B57510